MKLLKRHIEKDGSGSVALRLEYDEDLWHGAHSESTAGRALAALSSRDIRQ